MQSVAGFLSIFTILAVTVWTVDHAAATSGPGCLRVTNIESGDVLNIRRRANASSRVVGTINPDNQGILHLDAKCTPASRPWKSRWCPVSYFTGGPNDPTKGWVKARFVRDNDCP